MEWDMQYHWINIKRKKILYKVNIIDNFSLERFSIDDSDFKIYYYGNPKRLKLELLSFGYDLNNDNGYWGLKLNEWSTYFRLPYY